MKDEKMKGKNTRRLTGFHQLLSTLVHYYRLQFAQKNIVENFSFFYKVNKSIKNGKNFLIEHKCHIFEIIIMNKFERLFYIYCTFYHLHLHT